MKKLVVTLWTLAAVWLVGGPLQAETVNCIPIDSIPWTITDQGIHCFTQDLDSSLASGNAIEITVNNVTIDMNGFKLGNLAAGDTTTANGFSANNRKNITIRNGTIRGFQHGINLQGSSSAGHLIDGVRTDTNYRISIWVYGVGAIVRNCQVVTTGLATQTTAWGIVTMQGGLIANNDVTDVVASSLAIGVQVQGFDGVIVNNRITGTTAPTEYGANCSAASGTKVRDQTTLDVTTPINSCVDIGNNN